MITAARALRREDALQVGLGQRGFVHYWQREFAAGEACLAESLVLSEERGDGFEAFLARMFHGLARTNLGRMSEALIDFEHAKVLARRNGDRFWQPRLVSHAGLRPPRARRGREGPGARHRALALARENPSPWSPEVDAVVNLCVDGVRAGDAEGASDLLAVLEDGCAAIATGSAG